MIRGSSIEKVTFFVFFVCQLIQGKITPILSNIFPLVKKKVLFGKKHS